jgi:drug/metabolite transporter (DMT)-like permease
MPPPTVTLYTLVAMTVITLPALFFGDASSVISTNQSWVPLFGLTIVTFLSRLTLFMGVKNIGGTETALLGLSELIVTMTLSQLWLGERLNPQQWFGAFLLSTSIFLISFEKAPQKGRGSGGWLSWLSHPTLPSDIPSQPPDSHF